MALIGSINAQGELQGQINGARYITGVITNASAVGGQVVGMRGFQGEKGYQGDTGADGFSPSASVSKAGDTSTITITDKDGTTTADVYDGEVNVNDYGKLRIFNHGQLLTETARSTQDTLRFSAGENIQLALSNPDAPVIEISSDGGASAFIAEYGVTTYADVKDAYDEDAIILCTVDDSGNTAILQLAYFDDANDMFYFAQPYDEGWHWASIAIDGTWDDGSFYFANTDTATQLRDGLMSALDWQKLDGIASGAEVNVQSDWNEADSTDDAYIKNKPTIPTKVSDLNNDSGFTTKNIWYGTCSTSADTQTKVVTTTSGDFTLETGNMVRVQFDNSQEYDGVPKLNVDGTGVRDVVSYGTTVNSRVWYAGEVIDFVYTGSRFAVSKGATANTSRYGITILSTSTSSISTATAATSSAVKSAYDEAVDATATPTASKKSKFDSDAHMNSTDMTTGADSELEDFIDGLNVSGGGLVDYIVEQGTSGIWTYRKWNSGIAEAWGRTDVASATYSANGGLKNIVETLPSGLFNGTPNVVQASGRITGFSRTAMGFTSSDSATQIQTYLVNFTSSVYTGTAEVYWTVKGKWK